MIEAYLFWMWYVFSIRVYGLYKKGLLSNGQILFAATPVVLFVILDYLLNQLVGLIDWSGYKYQKEYTLSQRLSRWSREGGRRGKFADGFGKFFLHVYDDGDHYR